MKEPLQQHHAGPPRFEGKKTFVCFADLLGFKYLMSAERGLDAIREFYSSGKLWLDGLRGLPVTGIFVSDSAVLWSTCEEDHGKGIANMVLTIKLVFEMLLKKKLLPSASVTFGEFHYEGTSPAGSALQHPVYGDAYVRAYLDNGTTPWPGMCRFLLSDDFPPEALRWLKDSPCVIKEDKTGKRLDYYWMLSDSDEIENFSAELTRIGEELDNLRYDKTLTTLAEFYDAPSQRKIDRILSGDDK